MTENNKNLESREGYEYKSRQIEPMPERIFNFGEGRISGVVSVFLGVLSFLAVLCYQFPAYLTTAELRASYDAVFLQQVLKYAMYSSLFFALLTFVLGKRRRLGAIGVLFTLAGFGLGGYNIPTGSVEPSLWSFGLDWLVLALLVSSVLFIFLEKVFPKYREQAILRPDWALDLGYFTLNHLLISIVLLVANHFSSVLFGWAVNGSFQSLIQALPLFLQVVILIICADFVLYWSHRAFHENAFLWQFHAVHHSVEYMDWLAGSRNHVVQTFVDRCLAMLPIYLLGASKEALDIYVGFAAFQAVYIHANVGIPTGPLKYLLVTPQYHHWHHSSEKPAIDTNYAVHLPFLDMLFKTWHMPGAHWPAQYGTTKPLPDTFIGQLLYPFRRD